MQKMKLKFIIYLYKKKSTTRHKQHSKIRFEFKPWDCRQMVNIEYIILYYGQKFGLKCNKININNVCSFRSTYN
jgi:hypothetical protein